VRRPPSAMSAHATGTRAHALSAPYPFPRAARHASASLLPRPRSFPARASSHALRRGLRRPRALLPGPARLGRPARAQARPLGERQCLPRRLCQRGRHRRRRRPLPRACAAQPPPRVCEGGGCGERASRSVRERRRGLAPCAVVPCRVRAPPAAARRQPASASGEKERERERERDRERETEREREGQGQGQAVIAGMPCSAHPLPWPRLAC
jgi:hypothetical protein